VDLRSVPLDGVVAAVRHVPFDASLAQKGRRRGGREGKTYPRWRESASMKLARARTPDGVLQGDLELDEAGRPAEFHTDTGTYAVGGEGDENDADAGLLAPCEPSALYCVGRNFAETLDQMDYERPEDPDFFIKPPVSVHPPETPVEYPSFTEELTYAGELAAVIDRECHELAPEDVDDAVRGYTVLNDLDALDQPGRTARKAFDGSAPLGPAIETDIDPGDIAMRTTVGGELRQTASTEMMLFEPHEVIAVLSERFTFRPGDVVSFGSPANPGLVDPGEAVTIRYEGVGALHSTVVDSAE